MKNIQNRINTKLFKQEEKVELSEQVDLSATEDVKKAGQKAAAQMEKAYKSVFAVLSEIDKGITYAEAAIKVAKEAEADVKRVDKLAKELGVSLTPEYEKAAKQIDEIINLEGKQTLADLKKAKNAF